jgi:hypothetical protein
MNCKNVFSLTTGKRRNLKRRQGMTSLTIAIKIVMLEIKEIKEGIDGQIDRYLEKVKRIGMTREMVKVEMTRWTPGMRSLTNRKLGIDLTANVTTTLRKVINLRSLETKVTGWIEETDKIGVIEEIEGIGGDVIMIITGKVVTSNKMMVDLIVS